MKINQINTKNIEINEIIQLLQKHMSKNENIILFGEYKVGKTFILNELSKKINTNITHISDLRQRKNLPNSNLILLDECDKYSPQFKSPNPYKIVICTTHNIENAQGYIKYLSSSDKTVIYEIIRK